MGLGQRQHNAFTRTLVAISLAGLVLLTLPTIALVIRAFEAGDVLGDEASRDTLGTALRLSLGTSTLALAIVVLVGTPIAYVLARGRFPGARVLDALVDLPIILPPAVAGIALLAAFGRRGLLGDTFDALGISIAFSTTAVVIAQVFVAAPFHIRTARAGFSRVDHELEEAAADLGATGWQAFRLVTLPLMRNGVLAAAFVAFVLSSAEYTVSAFTSGRVQPLSVLVASDFRFHLSPKLNALAMLIVAFNVLVIVASELVRRGRPTMQKA